MIFHQVHLESLGHASYLVGSEQTGEALVLDVRRDVDVYYRLARREGLSIRYAADTHLHNDYVSGVAELRQRGPVELLASARASLGYAARAVADGERLEMGEVAFEVIHTPGHTPEHMSLLIRDRARGDEPVILLSGGALLVDDVARPDLLGGRGETLQGARELRHSLQEKILRLPDHVLVYPTHVAGSLCGGHIGSMLHTTIGYERRLNRLLQCLADQNAFLDACLDLEALPKVPPYWKRMRETNRAGPPPLGVLAPAPALGVGDFARRIEDGILVLDCRSPEAFGSGHIPGAWNVGLGGSFPAWAGTVLPAEASVLLVLERSDDLADATWELLRIGYPPPVGWLAGGMTAWRTAGRPLAFVPQWDVGRLARELEAGRAVTVVDVRQPAEWRSGKVPGALRLSGAELPWRVDEIPRNRRVAVYCGSGYRSSVAASVLRRAGYDEVVNVTGGFTAWKARGLPVEELQQAPAESQALPHL